MAESKLSINTRPWDLGGDGNIRDDKTISQISGRATDIEFLTVMAEKASNGELLPLADVNPALTAASMLCGANGGLIAAWQAVGDGSFKISVDGTELDITGLVFTGVSALTEISDIINIALAGRATCLYDDVGDAFTFVSPKLGLPGSTITVLTAGSAGTDISGTGFLNGLTTVGTVTDATGEASTGFPETIYMGADILAATVAGADVTDVPILVGRDKMIDEDMIVLEGTLTLDTIVPAVNRSIRSLLEDKGIYPRKSKNDQQIQPIA